MHGAPQRPRPRRLPPPRRRQRVVSRQRRLDDDYAAAALRHACPARRPPHPRARRGETAPRQTDNCARRTWCGWWMPPPVRWARGGEVSPSQVWWVPRARFDDGRGTTRCFWRRVSVRQARSFALAGSASTSLRVGGESRGSPTDPFGYSRVVLDGLDQVLPNELNPPTKQGHLGTLCTCVD